ncbi:hypothetical protein [Oceanirhabdus sp. W0125-5]|uniref:hypothetical protein n=1 Tax=Oceanirhabdus sp. W0125-5 TaxID=2999116 RepID=UPI0022F31A38|nr:hypothetical protein [Oceanirhabdus sp. W0125-5]WBW97055.1 hypothetical protein OW730_25690 [Oceanirhabdus sp. W0125-5]
MNKETLDSIRDKNIDVEYFSYQAIKDPSFREDVICELLTNKDIMVYYHCYYIVSKVSEIRPELFYDHWNDFVSLLSHKNSYHRDIGLTILANLVSVDENFYFDNILKEYLKHIDDEKFMTAQCCVKNLIKIVKGRKDLRGVIVQTLLEVEKRVSYHEKQRELLKFDVLNVFDEILEKSEYKDDMISFIKDCSNSISPKTKRKAKELIKKYF